MAKKTAKKKAVNKGGRPKSRPKNAVYLGLWVAKEVMDKANAEAVSQGRTRSEIIRDRLAAAFNVKE